jgi:hypothetical protein
MSRICREIYQAAVPDVQPDFTILSNHHQAEEGSRMTLIALRSRCLVFPTRDRGPGIAIVSNDCTKAYLLSSSNLCPLKLNFLDQNGNELNSTQVAQLTYELKQKFLVIIYFLHFS